MTDSGEAERVGRLVAVGGGKGGVGKSLVSANLAVALAQAGADVVLLDADLGAPNLHTLFGIHRPGRNVDDFLEGRVRSLAEVALDTGIERLRLVCGSPPVLGAANPPSALKQKLIRQLGTLGADVILIDVGAGVDLKVIDFFNAADIRLVVVTPEMTSMQNAYGFLKIAIYRRLQRAASGHPMSTGLTEAFGEGAFKIASGMEKMSTFLSLVEDESPDLAEPFRLLLREFNPRLVGNMLARQGDLNPIWAVQRMLKEFLGLEADLAASLRANPAVRASVNAGKPFAIEHPGDLDGLAFAKLARLVIDQDLRPLHRLRSRIASLLSASPSLGLESPEPVDEPTLRRISIPIPLPEPPPTPAQAAGITAEEFEKEHHKWQRASDRFQLRHPIEIEVDRHWYVGNLLEMNDAGALVAGVGPLVRGRTTGSLRVMSTGLGGSRAAHEVPVAVEFGAVDAESGGVAIQFADPLAAGSFVEYFRRIAEQAG